MKLFFNSLKPTLLVFTFIVILLTLYMHLDAMNEQRSNSLAEL